MRAAGLFEQGMIPAEVARQVGVSHQIVSDWRAAWRREGRDGLRAAGRRVVGHAGQALDDFSHALQGPQLNR